MAHMWYTLLVLSAAFASQGDAYHAYDSAIRPTARTVFWHVTNEECSAVHALNITNGKLTWRRNPVDEQQTWTTQIAERRVFYTLATGPLLSTVSVESGNIKWTWPTRGGHLFWHHWNTNLSQTHELASPLPAPDVQLTLLRSSQKGSSKVVAVNFTTGALSWEFDAFGTITTAALSSGLGKPRQVSVDGWLLGGSGIVYLSAVAIHNNAPAPGHLKHATHGDSQGAVGRSLREGMSRGEDDGTWSWPDPRSSDSDLVRGWVLCVDLTTGTLSWVSGPLGDSPISGMMMSVPALLVMSVPDAAKDAWLYGLDKVIGPKAGLMVRSLTRRPPTLENLAAFDLGTGAWLWRGLSTSALQALVADDCTAITPGYPYAYFACTCRASALPTSFSPKLHHASHGQPHTITQTINDDLSGLDGFNSMEDGERRLIADVDAAKRRPPSPPPVPILRPPGLCAFVLEVDTGKLQYEKILSVNDSVPVEAASYGLSPLVTPDLAVYPGKGGLYAVTYSVPSTNQPPKKGTHKAHGSADDFSVQTDMTDSDDGKGKAAAPPPHPIARVVYSYALPDGMQMQAWDWMDIKGTRLVFQASPAPLQVAFTTTRTKQSSTSMSGAGSNMGQGRHLSGTWFGGKGKDKNTDPAFPSAKIFALSKSGGTLLWTLDTNMSVGPLTPRQMPHEVTKNGLLLVDGCRPPLDELKRGMGWPWMRATGWAAENTQETGQRRMLVDGNSVTQGSSGKQQIVGAHQDDDGSDQVAAAHADSRERGIVGVGMGVERAQRGDDGERLGAGMSCCMYAVSVTSGHVVWRHCYDMDRACSSELAKHTATKIVYVLLVTQLVLVILGCMMGVSWNRAIAARRASHALQDPDGEVDPELEPMLITVTATPQGITHVGGWNGPRRHQDGE